MSLTWQDNVTPLNAANMNKLVQEDEVVAAATRIVANKLLAGDAQPAFQVGGDGKLSWGPGGSTAVDTTLYRSGANALKTDGSLVALDLTSGGNVTLSGTAGAFISRARTANGNMLVSRLTGDSVDRLAIDADGGINWGSGSGAADTSLYRVSTGQLATDGSFELRGAASSFIADKLGSNAYALLVQQSTDLAGQAFRFDIHSSGRLEWGPGGGVTAAPDTTLYRDSPGRLRVSSLQVTNNLGVELDAYITGKINFGGGDTNLYRFAAGSLQTDGLVRILGTGAGVGSGAASGLLLTWPSGRGVGWLEMGAADSGGAGYRMVRISN